MARPVLSGQSLANHPAESITAGLEPVWAAITGFQAAPGGPAAKNTAKTKKFGAVIGRPEFNLMNWTA